MKTFNLPFGITIEDSTDISCGIQITNQKSKFIRISYSSLDKNFYCTMIGKVMSFDDLTILETEISMIKIILRELQDLGYSIN